ncbi:MAG: DNA repair protein RecO [Chloroflexi bacterium]|nr:DNA repair protein RecO [Chloroflexota bacterium]
MTQPHLYRTEAVVLRHLDYGEADRILTLYTPQHGKVRAIAKGVRRPTSRLGGHLELATHAHLLIAHGRNLGIITQAETVHAFLGLREDLLRTSLACAVAELLDRLTPEESPSPPIFDLLIHTLDRLATTRQPELAARFFEVQLLGLSGYRPELHECLSCRTALGPSGNTFSAAAGGVLCPLCGRHQADGRALTTNAFKVLRLLQSGDYPTVSRLRLDETLAREVELTFRSYILYVAEANLRSAAFVDAVRARSAEC